MSRAVEAEPMIAPEGPKIGEIADSTTMCLPSLRMQTVSSGSTALAPAEALVDAPERGRRCRGSRSSTARPIISSAL